MFSLINADEKQVALYIYIKAQTYSLADEYRNTKVLSYKFSKILLDGSHKSDLWNILFHVKYIGDVNSY